MHPTALNYRAHEQMATLFYAFIHNRPVLSLFNVNSFNLDVLLIMLSTQLLHIFLSTKSRLMVHSRIGCIYQPASFVLLLNQSYQLLHSSNFPSTFWILSSCYFLVIHSSRDVLKCLVIDLSVFLPVCLTDRHGAFGAPSVWPTYFTYWNWVNWFKINAVSFILLLHRFVNIKCAIISPKDASSLILL